MSEQRAQRRPVGRRGPPDADVLELIDTFERLPGYAQLSDAFLRLLLGDATGPWRPPPT